MLLAPFMSMPAFCRVLFTCSCFAGLHALQVRLSSASLQQEHKPAFVASSSTTLATRVGIFLYLHSLSACVECRVAVVCSHLKQCVPSSCRHESVCSRARALPPARRTVLLRAAHPLFASAAQQHAPPPRGPMVSASLRVVNGRGGVVLLALACAPRRGPRREKRLPGAEGPPEGNVLR